MRKWIIVEDRPWVMKQFIQDMKQIAEENQESYEAPDILFFQPGEKDEQRQAYLKKYEKEIQEFKNITEIEPQMTYEADLEEKMDVYLAKQYIIFMDLNLTGDSAPYFYERQNVQYVLRQDKTVSNKLIWFYTTGASLDSGFLFEEFPDNYLMVDDFRDGIAYMDMAQAWRILKG